MDEAPHRDKLGSLEDFRRDLHQCLTKWPDALFELADAMLCVPAAVGSVPSLSLEPEFRRSHGSLYKALAQGRIDQERLRRLLVSHRPADWPLVFAVDASTFERCDAETSPERGFYHSASKHSAGQPIVAGWSYQWISQLSFDPDSWTAPVDATRIPPSEDATTATVNQVRRLVRLLPRDDQVPMFVFDAGYDPIAISDGLSDEAVQVLVRLRSDRVFYGDPIRRRRPGRGRPSRHGRRFKLSEREGRPEARRRYSPRRQALRQRTGAGVARPAPETARARPLVRCRGSPTDRARHRHQGRRRASAEAELARQQDTVAVVVRTGRARPRAVLSRLPAPFRPRAHIQVREEHARLDRSLAEDARAGRPLDLARRRRLHAAPTGAWPRRRHAHALGAAVSARQAHPGAGAARISASSCNYRHTRQRTEIDDGRSWTAERHTKTPKNPLSGGQKSGVARWLRFN